MVTLEHKHSNLTFRKPPFEVEQKVPGNIVYPPDVLPQTVQVELLSQRQLAIVAE